MLSGVLRELRSSRTAASSSSAEQSRLDQSRPDQSKDVKVGLRSRTNGVMGARQGMLEEGREERRGHSGDGQRAGEDRRVEPACTVPGCCFNPINPGPKTLAVPDSERARIVRHSALD